jgi:hypothetical protein
LVRVAIYKVQDNFHNRIERRATSKYMETIHETKDATPLVNGSAVPRGTARHAATCCGKFTAVRRSNRAQLDFSGMDPAATRGTARSVNAPVEIAGFDFSGTARYHTVSERYFSRFKNRF